MTAIVMNTMTGAVTEYGASFAFNSITATHAADGAKLYALGGDTDAGAPIEAKWLGPQLGGLELRRPDQVYVGLRAPAGSTCKVRVVAGGHAARGTEWQYDVAVQAAGISRCRNPGRGIRENYLAYGLIGSVPYVVSQFQIDEVNSQQRRAA